MKKTIVFISMFIVLIITVFGASFELEIANNATPSKVQVSPLISYDLGVSFSWRAQQFTLPFNASITGVRFKAGLIDEAGDQGTFNMSLKESIDITETNKLRYVEIDSHDLVVGYNLYNFSTPYTITPNQTYYIVFRGANETLSITHEIRWDDQYTDGGGWSYTGEDFNWTYDDTDDFIMNITYTSDCVTDWTCSDYAACGVTDTQVCNTTIDQNGCGLPYTGDYSEFSTQVCNYCTLSTSFTTDYSDWRYPLLHYCDDGYQIMTTTDPDWATCCDATGIAEDCYEGITDDDDGVYTVGNRTCESGYWANVDFAISYDWFKITTPSAPLVYSSAQWQSCEGYVVGGGDGVLSYWPIKDEPLWNWYLCGRENVVVSSPRLDGANGGAKFVPSGAIVGLGSIHNEVFNLTNNTRISMDVWDAGAGVLSFQNSSGKGGFVIPLGGTCAASSYAGSQPANANDIVCCDMGYSGTYTLNTTLQTVMDSCGALDAAHMSNLKQVEIKSNDDGYSFDDLVILPYDGFTPYHSTPPNITVSLVEDDGTSISLSNNNFSIEVNTSVNFTISTVDVDDDLPVYYDIDCGSDCSCDGDWPEQGGTYFILLGPNEEPNIQCTWTVEGEQTFNVYATDAGEIYRNPYGGSTYITKNAVYSTTELFTVTVEEEEEEEEETSTNYGGGITEDKKTGIEECTCNPGFDYKFTDIVDVTTDFEERQVDNYVRESVAKSTCGVDADQDGLLCDPNEDWISCPDDCDFPKLDEILCTGDKCMWTEAWLLYMVFAFQLIISIYLVWLEVK